MSSLAQVFSDIANSVRSKNGESTLYTPNQLAGAVNNISSGNASETLENIKYLNRNDNWNYPQYVVGMNINNTKNFSYTGVEGIYNNATMSGYDNSNPHTALGYNTIINYIYSNPSCTQLFKDGKIETSSEYDAIYFGAGVNGLTETFRNCPNFNQQVIVNSPLVSSLWGFFQDCSKFNQPFIIPDNITDIYSILGNCYEFNQPFIVPENVKTVSYAFWNCYNLSNIYFKNSSNITACSGMVRRFGVSSYNRINIWCNNTSPFTQGSIVGQSITWDTMLDGNGYYNTTFNVYLYNNYSS